MKLNAPEKCEVIVITIDKYQHPIAWKNRIESLINSGMTIQEANSEMIQRPTIEMELHYDVNCGAFLVESAAIESTEIYNPYTGSQLQIEGEEEISESEDDEDHIVLGDGMFDGSRAQFANCFFSNATNFQIAFFCRTEGVSLEINGKQIKIK